MDVSGNQILEEFNPQIIITELEETTENTIKDILYQLVERVVEPETRKRTFSFLDQDTEKTQENPKETETYTFSLGVCTGYGYSQSRKRYKRDPVTKGKVKPKGKNKVKTKQKLSPPEPVKKEDPHEKHNRILRQLSDTNPYYSTHMVLKKVLREQEPTIYDFSGKKPPHIYVITPNLRPRYMPYFSAYIHLQCFNGTILDWQIMLRSLALLKPVFSEYKSSLNIYVKPSKLYGPSRYFTRAANEIYEKNQKLRWAFKRLLNMWLKAKCKKRTMDSDLISMEKVPKEEQVKVYCTKSRTLYIFSGSSLLKLVKSSLETQQGSISGPKPPKNPFTNIPFTYAQMIKVSKELLKWCAKKNVKYPALLALYEESRYSVNFLLNLHNNYLQYLATRNYVFNDDINGNFFLENLEVLLDAYALFLVKYNRFLDIELFRAWFEEDKTNDLLRTWRLLICDYWHYKQTDHFIRPAWLTEMSILIDIEILLRASETKLRHYL
jgi:hypothetical protein